MFLLSWCCAPKSLKHSKPARQFLSAVNLWLRFWCFCSRGTSYQSRSNTQNLRGSFLSAVNRWLRFWCLCSRGAAHQSRSNTQNLRGSFFECGKPLAPVLVFLLPWCFAPKSLKHSKPARQFFSAVNLWLRFWCFCSRGASLPKSLKHSKPARQFFECG